MAQTLINGIRVPQGTDQSQPQVDMDRLARTVRTVLSAASEAEATGLIAQVREQLGWEPSPTAPVFVRRPDIAALGAWDGTRWMYQPDQVVGQIAWAGSLDLAPSAWYPVTWTNAKPVQVGGVTWTGSAFTVPYNGLYRVEAYLKTTSPLASTGRLGVGVVINGEQDGRSAECAAPSGADRVGVSLSVTIGLTAGSTVELRNRHDMGSVNVKREVCSLSVERAAAY